MIGLLITILSTTFVTSLMSWVLADDMTAESGIPFLSVKICLFVPSLLLSVGLLPVIAPPKATLWICCHGLPCPLDTNYIIIDFDNLTHVFLKTSSLIHSWNLLWHVEPEPYSVGSIFHWHPVLKMYRIPSSTF